MAHSSPGASTPETGVIVVPLSLADRDDAAALLASAFSEDRHTLGLLPEASGGNPAKGLRRLFQQMVAETLRSGGHAYFGLHPREDHPLGVVLWEAPGHKSASMSVSGLVNYARVFGPRLQDAARTELAMHRHRPRAPHWYLKLLGTHPKARGWGVGTALMESGLSQADQHQMGVYLESSSPDNVGFYARYGFVERSLIRARGTTPAIGMWRPPSGRLAC